MCQHRQGGSFDSSTLLPVSVYRKLSKNPETSQAPLAFWEGLIEETWDGTKTTGLRRCCIDVLLRREVGDSVPVGSFEEAYEEAASRQR